MKHWRVVRFRTPDEAERYLNGLSIQPDQIKGVFAGPRDGTDSAGGVVLVCWLSAHQQRIEQLQQAPRAEDDTAPLADPSAFSLPPPEPPPQREPRSSRRRLEEEES